MLRMKWLCVVLVGCALVATAAGADKKAGKAKGEKSALRGEYAIIASELKLTDEQKAKFTEAVAALEKTRAELTKANAPKMEELSKALAAAREAKDKAKAKEVSGQLSALKAEQEKSLAAARAKVAEALTPEQRAQWESFTLYRSVLGTFRKAELTDAQKEKIKSLAVEAHKQLAAATDAKAKSALRKDLDKQVTALLTPEQAAKLKAPAPKPADKAKPAEKTK